MEGTECDCSRSTGLTLSWRLRDVIDVVETEEPGMLTAALGDASSRGSTISGRRSKSFDPASGVSGVLIGFCCGGVVVVSTDAVRGRD